MNRRRPPVVLLVAGLLSIAGSLPARGHEEKLPYVSTWIAVGPGEPIPRVAPRAESAGSNAPGIAGSEVSRPGVAWAAPGLLLELQDGGEVEAAQIANFVTAAHEAGLRAGLSARIPGSLPGEASSAALSAKKLFPGLVAALDAARGVDLVELRLEQQGSGAAGFAVALKALAARVQAFHPRASVALTARGSGVTALRELLRSGFTAEEFPAYFNLLGLASPNGRLRAAGIRTLADELGTAIPLLVRLEEPVREESLLDAAAQFAPSGIPVTVGRLSTSPDPAEAPGGASTRSSRTAPAGSEGPNLSALRTFGKLAGTLGFDSREATARNPGDGQPLNAYRFVSGEDLGGLIVIPGVTQSGETHRGAVSVALDSPLYTSAEVLELSTGRSRTFEIPESMSAVRLSVSTANGPVAIRLTSRAAPPGQRAKAEAGVTAERSLTAEEILARHQVWRAGHDARWSRVSGTNTTSIRFRLVDKVNTVEVTLGGPIFMEQGKPYDWVWQSFLFNGIRWRGAKIPQVPLIQPEKVSELPLTLTFGDSYVYRKLDGETVRGRLCHVLEFEPRDDGKGMALYAGKVYLDAQDFSVVRTVTRQLGLKGEIQAVDETTDWTEVPAPDGGPPLRFGTRIQGQWVLRTFSQNTTVERAIELTDIRIDPPDFEDRRRAAYSSEATIVRDTSQGLRYMVKTPEKPGERVEAAKPRSAQIFGTLGAFYDESLDYPVPLAGIYYLDLDFRGKKQQVQGLFAGVLAIGSFSEPAVFGSKFDFGIDLIGLAISGTDRFFVSGVEDESQRVKQRSGSISFTLGYPVTRHLKLAGAFTVQGRDYTEYENKTAPDFAIPSDHFALKFELQATFERAGYSVQGRYALNRRLRWTPWGFPGNPDWDESKDSYDTYSVTVNKDFAFRGFRRLRTAAAFYGVTNPDRFSKVNFGFFGGTPLRGFSPGSLRAEKAAILKTAYGLALGELLRFELIYEHAFVTDKSAGLSWSSFGGAGLLAQFPGPWSSFIRIDIGTPVVGRDKGPRGFVAGLAIQKIF